MAELALKDLNQLRDLQKLPIVRQLGLLAGVTLAVAAGLALFFWSQSPTYVPVYRGLSPEDSMALADSLSASGVDFKVDSVTGDVTVPPDMLSQAKLRAAAQGLPKGAASGFEMIEKDQGFGTSQFIENARYQLAIETELARTVSSLQPVRSARVHLALPKPSAFAASRQAASASVVVELHSGRSLEPRQVESIEHLVASSVPNMSPSSVSVIDQFGRLLSGPEDVSELAKSNEQYDYRRRIEADYARRIVTLLTPMLGADRVSADVSADIDFSQVEEASERYVPDEAAVRSEQINENTRGDAEPRGVPGALSNQPPETGDDAARQADSRGRSASSSSRQVTRNYEMDRTVSHKRTSVGNIDRLSVAVLVDYMMKVDEEGQAVATPLSEAQLSKVEALVKQAVGFDAGRGDSVTVQNAEFQPLTLEAPAPLPLWERPEFRDWLRHGLGALVVLILIFAVVKPLLRSLLGPPPATEDQEVVSVSVEDGPVGAIEDLESDRLSLSRDDPNALSLKPPTDYEQRLAIARSAVAQDPKRVAQLVKSWLNEDG